MTFDNVVNCRRPDDLLGWRIFRQLALKRPPMNAQKFRGLRDVPVAVGKNALDMFPFDSRKRRHGGWRMLLGRVYAQFSISIENLFGVSGFCQVMIGAEFQRLHRGGNASISREHHHRDCRIDLFDALNQIQSAEIGHLHVEQHEIRTDALRKLHALFFRTGFMSFATAVA